MPDVETLSHVDLLDAYDALGDLRRVHPEYRAEILRRMDSACTSQRDEIEPHPDEYRR